MRSAYALSIASCLLFTSSIAFTRQQQQALAEEQFKNIKSFKGKKASDVIPAMQFMCASLKVRCDYCHTQDFSADTKGQKNTTRDMIAMQNDINTKNFGGRTVVTCATCHAGHTHPVAFPPVLGVETRARRSRDVTPDQIVAAFAKAVGDAGSKPLPNIRMEGLDVSNGKKLKTEAVYAGDKYYFITHDVKSDTKFGSNGTSTWYAAGPEAQTLPPEVAAQFKNQTTLYTGPASLPKLTNPSGGTAQIAGKDMLVLTGTMPDGSTRASIFFDKATGLPARTLFLYPTIIGSIAQINDYSDYKKISGFELPTTIGNHSGSEDTIRHYTSITLAGTTDPKIFEPAK